MSTDIEFSPPPVRTAGPVDGPAGGVNPVRLMLAIYIAVVIGLLGYQLWQRYFPTPYTARNWQEAAADELLGPDLKPKVHVPVTDVGSILAYQARAKADGTPPALLLDVREDRERAVSMLPGAITQAQLDADPTLVEGRYVVVYCTIGVRSADATKALRERGVNAANLVGGILAWIDAGQPILDPDTGKPTKRVHTYGKRWAHVPPGYTAVY